MEEFSFCQVAPSWCFLNFAQCRKHQVGSTKQQLNSSNQICKTRNATYLTPKLTRNLVTVILCVKYVKITYSGNHWIQQPIPKLRTMNFFQFFSQSDYLFQKFKLIKLRFVSFEFWLSQPDFQKEKNFLFRAIFSPGKTIFVLPESFSRPWVVFGNGHWRRRWKKTQKNVDH